MKLYPYTCQQCGKEFSNRIPHNRKTSPKYCSRPCQFESQNSRPLRDCLVCNEPFRVMTNRTKYCSQGCYFESLKGRSREYLQCETCGELFEKDGKKNSSKTRYCSSKCYGASMLSAAPRKGKEFSKAVRKAIKERDNYTCVLCGSTDKIDVDHVLCIGLGGENSIENGRVLCVDCHKKKTISDRAKIRAQRQR